MPLPRFHKLDSARKEAILEAAKSEFAARGFSGASYNAIIKSAGLSKGAMYYYFSDKADLCRTVLAQALDQMAERVGPLAPFEDASGFWSAVEAMFGRAMNLLVTMPELGDLGRLIYGEGTTSPLFQEVVQRCEAFATDVLEQGQAVGAVRTDMPLELLATSLTGLGVHADRWFAENMNSLPNAELARLSVLSLQMMEQLAAPVPADFKPNMAASNGVDLPGFDGREMAEE